MKEKIFLLSLLAFVLLVIFGVGVVILNSQYPTKYSEYVTKYAQENSVDVSMIYGIIKQESNFNATAVSSAGAVGLMQLLPSTAKWFATEIGEEYAYEKLFDPEYNIKIGIAYLKYLQNKFGDEVAVLCAYNAGEGVVSGWVSNVNFNIDLIPYAETKSYVVGVKKNMERYDNILS